jgi:DNA-binding transcriptional LysR family regulator
MQLEIRHVRVLLALVEEKTVTRAARRLGIPQPALSSQLRRIERYLGQRLFERSSMGVALTDSGRRLLPQLHAVEDGMRRLEQSRSRTDSPTQRAVRVGLESAALLDVLEAQPSVAGALLQLAIAGPSVTRPALFDGIFDFVETSDLTAESVPVPRPFRAATLLEEPIGLLVPPLHPLRNRTRLRLGELAVFDWVSYLPGTDWHQALLRRCAAAGFTPRVRYLVSSDLGLSGLLERNDMIALGTAIGAARGGVDLHSLDIDMTRRALAVWNTATCPPQLAEGLLARIKAWYAETVGDAVTR